MIDFPNAKINLGLKIVRKRDDGYHDIETVMYPVLLCDILEILESDHGETTLKCSGISIDVSTEKIEKQEKGVSGFIPLKTDNNLVQKIYELLKSDYNLPPVFMHLHKAIPVGAGLGGGSSDGTFALKMLNRLFKIRLSPEQLHSYASALGSDCAFFLENKPMLATGRGENLSPIHLDLKGFYILIVKPNLHINTSQAYSWIKPTPPAESLAEILSSPIQHWKHRLVNDFEAPVFQRHPELKNIKEQLYTSEALYASMSGSGSAMFGIFDKKPQLLRVPEGYFQWAGVL